MKPTAVDYANAVLRMAEVVPWFPQSQNAKNTIAQALESFVDSEEGLNWLTETVILECEDWQDSGGIAGYRNRYREHLSELRDQLEQAEQDRKILEWKKERDRELAAGEETGVRPITRQITSGDGLRTSVITRQEGQE